MCLSVISVSDGLAKWVRANTVVALIENMIENIMMLNLIFFSRASHLSVNTTQKHHEAVEG